MRASYLVTARTPAATPATEPTASRRTTDPILLVILAFGLALRLWGLGYGLPHVYNPDEVSILSRALGTARSLNPGNFVYPSFFFYLLAAVIGGLFGLEWLAGQVTSVSAFEQAFWADPTGVFLAARGLSVAAGVGTIAATYALARHVGSRRTARCAAFLMAVAYIPVRDAHMVKHDVFVTLLVALVVLAARRVWDRGAQADYLWSGALVGLSCATHYYAIFTAVPVAAAHLLRTGMRPASWRSRKPWLAAAAAAAVFALFSPFVLIEHNRAWADIVANRRILFDRTQVEMTVWQPAMRQAEILLAQGAGVPMALAALVGLVLLIRQSRPTAVWLLSCPAIFALMLTRAYPYGRLQNVLYPGIATLAALTITRLSGSRRSAASLAMGLTLVAGAQPLWNDVLLDRLMTKVDTRTEAAAWIAAHVPAGSGIALDVYSVPLEPTAESLRRTIAAKARGKETGARDRGWLARNPYPAPAYRLFYLGVDGRDEDKEYLDPAILGGPDGPSALDARQVEYIIVKDADGTSASRPLRLLPAGATLAVRISPFAPGVIPAETQRPDFDVRPSLDVIQPGPVIDVWRVPRRR